MNDLDVNEARKRLIAALGESSKSYFAHLKSWFCMRTNKEEFDHQARLFLPPHLVYLHNEFLLAVLTKCQSLCQPTTYNYQGIKQRPTAVSLPTVKAKPFNDPVTPPSAIEIKPVVVTRGVKHKVKAVKVNFENRFQPADPVALLPSAASPLPLDKAQPVLRSCTRDSCMPDSALIHGRMLVAAWDIGLDQGCQDQAIQLILVATQDFLKQLIVAIIKNRKGYRLRENNMAHSVGLPTLNPWLHNSWNVHDTASNSHATHVSHHCQPPHHVPAMPPVESKATRDSAFYVACCTYSDRERKGLPPISVMDVFQTLQVHKNVIPWHSVYAVNMERISQRLYHPD